MKISTFLIVVCLMLLAVPSVTMNVESASYVPVDFVINDNETIIQYDFVIDDADMTVEEVLSQVSQENNITFEIARNSYVTAQGSYKVYCDEIYSITINGTTFTEWSNETVHCEWWIYVADELVFDMDAQVRSNVPVRFEYVRIYVNTDPDINAEMYIQREEEYTPPADRVINSLNDENNELKFLLKSLSTATITLGICALFCWFMWAKRDTEVHSLKHKIHELENKGGE